MTRNKYIYSKRKAKKSRSFRILNLIIQEKSWTLATRVITVEKNTIGTNWTNFTTRSAMIVVTILILQWFTIIAP
jgi:hypothetical protein